MTVVLGIDPGKHGALALLDSYGEILWVEDMPLVGNQVDARELADLVFDAVSGTGEGNGECIAVIEDVHSSPQMGVVGAFSFGKSLGIVLGVCAAEAVRIEMVSPHRWKAAMRLNVPTAKGTKNTFGRTGTAAKELARARAIDRWPRSRERFKNKKDADRAEAALIGLWWIEDNARTKPKENA